MHNLNNEMNIFEDGTGSKTISVVMKDIDKFKKNV